MNPLARAALAAVQAQEVPKDRGKLVKPLPGAPCGGYGGKEGEE